ncbi:hypothetical protein H9660_09675 [Clostridium sp. Sa3CUN1]|uniref:DUF1819 domain-containing protein n=1 Tax=Clostridium gallinarum TaxID=2762246 RepID=A0ABR8Q4S2_9CLOT|nr:hypothetical protein [Clostridium gallinarum]MBD7915417.1 hypothetical protein [Clostridium gallinarum]
MSKVIGMSRNINLDWLNETANLVLAGKSEEEIKESLNEYLGFTINSPTNLRKTREILMNIWVRTEEKDFAIKKLALDLVNTNKALNKLVAHWCMMLLAYPVFGDIVTAIGKMADKQFDITTAQVKTRMFDVWGERSTLYHSIDKNIKTLKDIGTLGTIKTGLYKVEKFDIEDERAVTLIVATLLTLKEKLYMRIEELENSYEFYPFKYDVNLENLQMSGMFSFDKFGGEIVISIRG